MVEILQALVGQLPQYRLMVSPGVLEIYSPKARADTSNLLNTIIDSFEATNESPRVVSAQIRDAMLAKLHLACCGVGHALGSGHPRYVTLNLRKKRVYELLNALVAQTGESIWTAVASPQNLSAPDAKLWEVYGLGPGWEESVLADLQGLFPRDN